MKKILIVLTVGLVLASPVWAYSSSYGHKRDDNHGRFTRHVEPRGNSRFYFQSSARQKLCRLCHHIWSPHHRCLARYDHRRDCFKDRLYGDIFSFRQIGTHGSILVGYKY